MLIAAGFQNVRADDEVERKFDGIRQVAGSDFGKRVSNSRPAEKRAQDKELEKRVRVLRKGTSSRSSRKAAWEALPLGKLNETGQKQALEILRTAAMFRELPTLECDVEPDVYRFFTQHPDVAVSIWRAMKISVFQMTQAGPRSYDVDSGDGTTGRVEVLLESDDESLVICSGAFKTPLVPKPIHATGLFHLQTKMKRREDGTAFATHRGRMFVAFPSQTVGTVAKVISPVSNLIVDRNFREVSLFLHMMSMAMQQQPGWIEHITKKLDGVPEERRTELLKLTARMYVDARKRALAAAGKRIEQIDQFLPPTLEPTAENGNPAAPRVAAQPMSSTN